MKWTTEEYNQMSKRVDHIYFEKFSEADEVPWDALWLLAEVELKLGRELTLDERDIMSITADICYSNFVEEEKDGRVHPET